VLTYFVRKLVGECSRLARSPANFTLTSRQGKDVNSSAFCIRQADQLLSNLLCIRLPDRSVLRVPDQIGKCGIEDDHDLCSREHRWYLCSQLRRWYRWSGPMALVRASWKE